MNLYNYYRSSASYRVRIALNIKQIHYDIIDVNIFPGINEQQSQDYRALNPQGLVPTLDENGHIITQSLAIIEYLEDICPIPSILPKNPIGKAHTRALAMIIACDMHPLNNLRVLQQLKNQLNASETQVTQWYHHWLKEGFDAFEQKLSTHPRKHPVCYGENISIADICLIPQVYNAKRFHFSMDAYPLINEITDYCNTLQAFTEATPRT